MLWEKMGFNLDHIIVQTGERIDLKLDNKNRKMKFDGTLIELLKKLGVMREEVVVKVNGKLAPETTKLKKTDKVEIIKVVFGG